MSTHLAVLLCGFTLAASPVLAIVYLFFLPDMRKSTSSKIACTFMLIVLCLLQGMHYWSFTEGLELINSRIYLITLTIAPGAFYLFSRTVLFTEFRISLPQLIHLGWFLFGIFLPVELVPTVAFVIGTGYTLWIASFVWGLRAHRDHFHLEMFFFSLFALMALSALVFGLALPFMGSELFFLYYSSSIGIAMVLVVAALIVFPELLSDIMTVSEIVYAKSKLDGVDIVSAEARLERLLTEDRVYQNENLNLGFLAELVELSPHQLSELINTRYSMGFPRFIRDKRVAEAKKLLLEEPDTSILAISMMTGFKSQSNFYTAFKESTGLSPGSFRQQRLGITQNTTDL